MNETQTQNLKGPKVGSLVEIRSGSAWYEGVITQNPTKQQILYSVKYTSSNTKNILFVSASMIRPRSPCKRSSLTVYEVFQEVEAFYKDGWWSGVVVKKDFQNDDLCYSVFVLDLGEEILFKAINLRKKMDWINGIWISDEQAAKNKDRMHSKFGEGKQVEVSNNTQNYGLSWHASTVLKMIGKSCFLVEYTTSKRNNNTSSLQEIVDVKHIRPCPPVSESTSFKVGDKVEVLHEGGWILGFISVTVSKDRYIVKLKDQEGEAKVLKVTSLRPYYVWSDDHWDRISQGVDVQDVGSSSSDSKERNALTHSNESHAQSSQSTKKMKIDTTPEKFCLQDDCHHPSKNSNCNSEYDCNMRTELPLNDILFTKSSVVTSTEDNQSCHIVNVDNVCERENIPVKDKSKGCETPVSNPVSKRISIVQSKKIESPFSPQKKNELIKLVESTNEVFSLFPQDPHFHPLLKYEKAMREGLACGTMMAFAGLVNDVRSYTVYVSENEIEEKLKALYYFKEHGFNIQPVQNTLNNLIMLRKQLDELEGKKKSTIVELEETKQEKEREYSLLSEIEKNIIALNEQRTFVTLKMKKHSHKIGNLKSVARTIEDDIVDAKRQINDILTAPW